MKKVIGLVLSVVIIGYTIVLGYDRVMLYQEKEDLIETFEEQGWLDEEYDIRIKGNTIEIIEYYSEDDVTVWDEYDLGADELAYLTAEHSGHVKERLDSKTINDKYHCKIIMKTHEGTKVGVVEDGEVLFNYFE